MGRAHRNGAMNLVRFPGPRRKALWQAIKVADSIRALPSAPLPVEWPTAILDDLWQRLYETSGPHQTARYRVLVFAGSTDRRPNRAIALFGNNNGVSAVAKFAFDRTGTAKLQSEVAANQVPLILPTGYDRPAMLFSSFAADAGAANGVALWHGVPEVGPNRRRPEPTKIDIRLGEGVAEFAPWDDEVIALVTPIVTGAGGSADWVADTIGTVNRVPVHGDVTAGNLLTSNNTNWLIDWENFHPAGPALTDTVTQLLDAAQAKPGNRTNNAVALLANHQIDQTMPALGFIARQGNPLAETVLEQLVQADQLNTKREPN